MAQLIVVKVFIEHCDITAKYISLNAVLTVCMNGYGPGMSIK